MATTRDTHASRQQRLRRLPCRVATTSFVVVFLFGALPSARADIDNAELMAKTTLKDKKSQAEYLRRIAEEQAAEAKREAELAAEAEREAEALRKAEEARPWPERLTEMRCTKCHVARHYTDNGHTSAGWWVVLLRMRYVNDALLTWEEKSTIASYLKEQYPARGSDYMIEWLSIVAGLLAVPGGVLFGRWYRNKRKGSP